jgi:multiple sugar transport system substrate-binding protein
MFDFFPTYYAASVGKQLTSGTDLTADDTAGIATLGLYGDLAAKGAILTQQATDPWATGSTVYDVSGPWNIPTYATKYPQLVYGQNWTVTPVVVPDGNATSTVKTYGDSKGLSVFSSATAGQQKAALDFVAWVYSDPQHDLTYLKTVGSMPARTDISTNPAFVDYLKANPAFVPFANNVANTVGIIQNASYQDIWQAIGEKGMSPVVKGTAPDTAWASVKSAVQGLLAK